jgi:hypothetical protein
MQPSRWSWHLVLSIFSRGHNLGEPGCDAAAYRFAFTFLPARDFWVTVQVNHIGRALKNYPDDKKDHDYHN